MSYKGSINIPDSIGILIESMFVFNIFSINPEKAHREMSDISFKSSSRITQAPINFSYSRLQSPSGAGTAYPSFPHS